MKKTALLSAIIMAFSFGSLNAQTNQGMSLIGVSSALSLAGTGSDLMSLGFSSMKYKSDLDGFEESDADKTTSFNMLPKVAYFVADNVAAGLDLNIATSSTKDGEDSDKFSQTLFSAGPFFRYYIPTSKVFPFIEVTSSFGSVTNKFDYSDNTFWEDDEYKSSVMSIGGGVGIASPLGERVMFDAQAGYTSLTIKDKEDNDNNFRTVIGTIGLKLGFTVFFGQGSN